MRKSKIVRILRKPLHCQVLQTSLLNTQLTSQHAPREDKPWPPCAYGHSMAYATPRCYIADQHEGSNSQLQRALMPTHAPMESHPSAEPRVFVRPQIGNAEARANLSCKSLSSNTTYSCRRKRHFTAATLSALVRRTEAD